MVCCGRRDGAQNEENDFCAVQGEGRGVYSFIDSCIDIHIQLLEDYQDALFD